ncbi:MAG: hemopexin repeat-containing protein [Pseudonocardiaceae bacterium]
MTVASAPVHWHRLVIELQSEGIDVSRDGSLPNYRRLFGELDLRPVDESRSVWSPAAYLTELLRLVDGDIPGATLLRRRPDIPQIALNAANTVTEEPYLDVVNGILEKAVDGEDPYGRLREMWFPFDMPFSLPHQRLRRHLLRLGMDPADFYRWFAVPADPDLVARERLGLSPEEVDVVTVARPAESDVRELYGLAADEPVAALEHLDRFRRATGLSGAEVGELLWQRQSGPGSDTASAFVHRGGPVVGLDEDGTRLTTEGPADGKVPPDWFERVSRFVRLARRTGLSLPDLDLVLRSCCASVLDTAALRTLAVVLELRTRLDLPIDVVCSLAAPMDTAGFAGGVGSPDLFGRTFAPAPAGSGVPARAVIRPRPDTAPADALWTRAAEPGELVCTGDVLAPANRPFRQRVSAALGLAEADLVTVVQRLRDHHARTSGEPSPFDRGTVGLGALSLLHRVATLTVALGIGVDELFAVLEVMDRDPSLRRYTSFPILIPLAAAEADPYRMLDAPDPASGLCLAQMLVAVTAWMHESGVTGDDLTTLVADADRAERDTVLTSLRARRDEVAVTPELFVSDRFGRRAARVLHDVLTDHAGVVSASDPRLLRLDAAAVGVAAYDAVTDLAAVTAEDLLGLGLDERTTTKLVTNLVLRGYLAADGAIVDAAVPATGPLLPASNFAAYREPLFALVRTLWQDGDTDAEPDPEEPAFLYPADLEGLAAWAGLPELGAAERAELYDNLVHLGYLAPDGEVLARAFFADPGGATHLQVDVDLEDLAEPVAVALRARLAAFRAAQVELGPRTFAGLVPDGDRLAALLANLQFNGYRDETGHYRDPAAVAALRPDEFALAPDLEPLRHDVLAAMQVQLAEVRTQLCTVTVDDLSPLVDAALAARTVAALEGTYLDNGALRPELWPLLADRAGDPAGTVTGTDDLPPLPADLPPADRALVLERLRAVLTDLRPYHLDPAALAGLGLTPEESRQVVAVLVEAGHLEEWLTLPYDRLARFAAPVGAAGFTLPGFVDYATEVFDLLHAIARELTAAVAEIGDTLDEQARRQETGLLSVLQDAVGLPRETVAALCRAVSRAPGPAARSAPEAPDAPEILDTLETLLGTGDPAPSPATRVTYQRIRTFARLAARLGLDAVDVAVVFADQDLAGNFPEALVLPPGLDRFDALLESADGTVYVFTGPACHRYSATTYALRDAAPVALTELSAALAPLAGVDAAFTRADGSEWLVGRDVAGTALAFVRRPGSSRWVATDQEWGAVANTFTDPARIDAAFTDADGRVYLFCGGQYVRYTGADLATVDAAFVDEGYPRAISDWWSGELDATAPPAGFTGPPDAAFADADGRVHLFRGDRCLTVGEADRPTAEVWGRTPTPFTDRVDAAYSDGSVVYLLAGDVVVAHRDGPENPGLRVDDGYPRRIATHFPDAPAGFDNGLDAVLREPDGVVHLFKDGRTVTLGPDPQVRPTAEVWGRIAAPLTDGRVDAVLAGLDGRTYLFSGGRYVRFSGADYAVTDLGYPRAIDGNWGCLVAVDAAFVLDGRTYLFGPADDLFDIPAGWAATLAGDRLPPLLRARFAEHDITFAADARITAEPDGGWRTVDEHGTAYTVRRRPDRLTVAVADRTRFYVRYSTRDYTTPDPGHPRPLHDGWWNLPDALRAGVTDVDAVFTGRGGQTYLFCGSRYITFDARRRWWSAPRTLAEDWDSLPFDRVDAAFLGRDGRTYLFSGDRYVRYSTADYTRVDDRYPASIAGFWGRVPNRLARTGRVDAALVLDAVETVDGAEVTRTYTYLFSGDQYVRYLDTDLDTVQDGYPAPLSALSAEPRLDALPVTLDRVDAAFADRHSVHLLVGDRWHVVSDALYRTYPDVPDVRCAFLEDGALMLEGTAGWRHADAVDAPQRGARPARPRVLRTVPERFATGLDAVLAGTDGDTYLFRDGSCYDVRLGQEYPVAEAWGMPRDTITRDGVVDAAFVDAAGVTHLFRGDQFVSFAPSGAAYAGREEQSGPWPVSEHWGGLTSVALAYVEDGRTHVFERPGADGRMRYVTWTGTGGPEPGGPRLVDASFWDAPLGFGPPAAVLVREGATLLLSGERFVQRSGPDDPWSLPQPIGLLWRHDPVTNPTGVPTGAVLRTAFVGRDGATHFFFTPGGPGDRFGEVVGDVTGDRYARWSDGAFDPAVDVRRAWGYPAFDRVDAAFVDAGGTTYLFSGDRYARYSVADYRDADPGYPKPIAGHLRTEEPFGNLPESFEDTAAVRGVDAVVGNDRSVYVFAGGVCHVAARSRYAVRATAALGRVRDPIAERGRVDAALRTDQHTYLFSEDLYVRYTEGAGTVLTDDGYPRTIEGSLAADLGLPELPVEFCDGVDAALRDRDGGIHLFRGAHHLHANAADPQVRPVAGRWGRVRTTFGPGLPLDAAFVASSGALYAFRGDQYVRYGGAEPTHVDPGYPRTIRDDWGDLPAAFEDGIDGAFSFAGATYLLLGADHVRYRAGRYTAVDHAFPQPLRDRFGGTADYRLGDVHVISRYARLSRASGGELGALLGGGTAVEDPYGRLAELFGWDAEEIRWVQRHGGFLSVPRAEQDRLEIEIVLRLAELFASTARLRIGPSRLYDAVWAPAHTGAADPGRATDGLLGLLADVLAPDELATFTARMHEELSELCRDTLVSAVLADDPAPAPGALYERLLIDVDMGADGTTSRIREAIAATQLYVHRYLLDLEPAGVAPQPGDAAARPQVRRWWEWLRTYRTWEANRKVLLYPENYLRPELRDTRTPAFRQLESDLLQGGITTDTVQTAYKRYLDEYTEVSRLAIAGGYVYSPADEAPGTRKLVLFGRTRTSPRRYYCRSATFHPGARSSAAWEAWARVDVQIDAENVYPVHAFGRLFVFWATVENAAPDRPDRSVVVATKAEGDTQQVSGPATQQVVKIFFSFRNLNQEWVPAQVLGTGIPASELRDVRLSVRSGALPDQAGGHQAILASYTAGVGVLPATLPEWILAVLGTTMAPVQATFGLTPELYAVGVPSAAVEPPHPEDVSAIFTEPDVIAPSDVVWFGSQQGLAEGPWFSVDHKGGSFLCRPVLPAPAEPPQPASTEGNKDPMMPSWRRIDAAVELPDGSRIFFDNENARFMLIKAGNTRGAASSISSRWGRTDPPGTDYSSKIDAVLLRGGTLFVFTGDRYLRYDAAKVSAAVASKTSLGLPDAGYPKSLRDNTERLPQWSRVDMAYSGEGGIEYFLSFAQQEWVTSANLTTVRSVNNASDVTTIAAADRPSLATLAVRTVTARGPAAVADAIKSAFTKQGVTLREEEWAPPATPAVDLGAKWSSVDAGFVGTTGTHLYLVSGNQYVRYTISSDGSVPGVVDAGYPRAMTQPVTALFHQDGRPYALRGDLYAALPQTGDPVPPGRFLPTADRWAGLPTGITGALDGRDDLYFFLGPNYIRYSRDRTQYHPYEFAAQPHEIVRLTTSTAYKLNERLLTGGMAALLDTTTQETDELPAFSTDVSDATTVRLQADRVDRDWLPAGAHLDFRSANGVYYWEIFFHAPLLIAQALNGAQRFADARVWYEYVFDPTQPDQYWRFLPFLGADPAALAADLRDGLDALRPALPAGTSMADLEAVAATLDRLVPAFQGTADPDPADLNRLDTVAMPPELDALRGDPAHTALAETLALVPELHRQYELRADRDGQLAAYRDDPFDPHTIAALRPTAYRRAVVMGYVDNLIDWGDLLFRQYTPESIDEARMLYILAQDLLGRPPQTTGPRPPADECTYAQLRERGDVPGSPQEALDELLGRAAAPTDPSTEPYFFVPGNATLAGYWDLVTDRLGKIRRSQDILGISRPVPLFAPPLDPAALVRGVAAGGGVEAVTGAVAAPVPHYRFTVMLARAQELTDRLRQFGQDLLAALDRRDAEQLTLLQNRQEGEILTITRAAREAQMGMAEAGVASARVARDAAAARIAHYEKLIDDGPSPAQVAQMSMMSVASALHLASGGLKIGAAIAQGVPQTLIGPFIMGVEVGGEQIGGALETTSEVSESFGEGFSVIGELMGVVAEQEQTRQEWEFQAAVARADLAQMEPEVTAAELALTAARRELDVLDRQITQQSEVAAFLRDKFTGAELYQWTASRLGALYFRAYGLAEDTARAAERAFRFERGLPENGTSYITPGYWESRRAGLLAGEQLGSDLDRLAAAHRDGHRRGLEITKRVSLREVDPLVLLRLRSDGACEIVLTEDLFDRDFPGHYRRQVRSVAVRITDADDAVLPLAAMLTQVGHRTVLEPDPKAVKHMLNPQGTPPSTLRYDWRADQRIALSDVPGDAENNGLHELRYDDDRYLPFEGTGAVATWRLELTGRRPPSGLPADVVLILRYTAEDGGAAFATAVRGMLRPRPAARYVDVATEFPDEWEAFADGDTDDLVLPLDPDGFPGMVGRQVTGLFAAYPTDGTDGTGGVPRLLLDGDPDLVLADGRLLPTPGLALPADGSGLTLTAERPGARPAGLVLIVTYPSST